MKNKFQAFSVLEGVLAILLIGILSSIIIPYWQVLNMQKNITVTKVKANYIRKAIEGYVFRYGHLPYACAENGVSQELLLNGYVPYKTLGINKSYAIDGFGKKFTYIANYNLTQPKATKNKAFKKGLLPITLPNTIYPALGNGYFRTFCRNYTFLMKPDEKSKWESKYNYAPYIKLHEYDKIDFENNINLIKNGKQKPIKKINIQKMHVNVTDYQRNERNAQNSNQSSAESKRTTSYNNKTKFSKFSQNARMNSLEDLLCIDDFSENYDITAWALICHRCSLNIDKKNEVILDCIDLIFFQSRFNLAGMIKNPCTQASLDVTQVLFKNEHEERAVCA